MDYQQLIRTDAEKTIIPIRLLVGIVFATEGLQKFLYPNLRGAGRFESIGIPFPEFTGYMVGGFEVIFGPMSMLHESRNDLAMLISSVFLWFKVGGSWSLDYRMQNNIDKNI